MSTRTGTKEWEKARHYGTTATELRPRVTTVVQRAYGEQTEKAHSLPPREVAHLSLTHCPAGISWQRSNLATAPRIVHCPKRQSARHQSARPTPQPPTSKDGTHITTPESPPTDHTLRSPIDHISPAAAIYPPPSYSSRQPSPQALLPLAHYAWKALHPSRRITDPTTGHEGPPPEDAGVIKHESLILRAVCVK
ncbi:hypothetical protein BU26DRAFT_350193 [Trematosphaeria pertusa]|uniref:Uncharacterized protein n=1 Tax=Trematosphaeria pertusa TaxID=390896 RepID=A0A6A6IBZ7_9PLEO|nr:uncharacterized protein BU26DRAFT_350193 [Trematosphaeria pertusa]KAF2247588.1 hypothetical protein BU26DRAFT_350193 [Trematosphaeria pertusa]